MKKIFTLALLAVTLLTANAKSRKWDFSNWSAATVANLQKGLAANCSTDAEAVSPACGWSEFQKTTGTIATAEGGKAFYEIKGQGNVKDGVSSVTIDGQPIAEFEGLLYVNNVARSFAIALNRGSGHGVQYAWFLGKDKPFFVIPNVKPGAKIKMGIESHAPDKGARGVKLYIGKKGSYNVKGTELKDPDGNAVDLPTTYEDQTWLVPEEGLTEEPNEDGTYDVVIYSTDSSHCYYIKVDEGDNMEENKKLAWVYDSTPQAYAFAVKPSDAFDFEEIDASNAENVTDSILRSYDGVVIDNTVTTATAGYAQLQNNIAFVPMINLNTSLFGYTAAEASTTMTVSKPDDEDYWANIALDEGTFAYGENVAVTLPERFANDEIIATQDGQVAIHRHDNGAGKNSYFLLGSTDECLGVYEDWATLFANIATVAAQTKKTVTAAAAPTFALAYADGQTTVTIACATPGNSIYYKEGEGDYKLYTDPVLCTEATMLTAYAVSEGYLQGAEASKDVDIQTQAAAPTIAVDQQDGKSLVTLASEDGATVYYSFSGQTKTANMATYTEPVEVTEPGSITTLAIVEGKLQSETVTGDIRVKGIPEVTDTLSHFTGNEEDWYTNAIVTANGESTALADAITEGMASGKSSAVYYFNNASWNYYSDEVEKTETYKDVDGNDSIVYYYKADPAALKVVSSTTNTDWVIKSQGQVITGETTLAPALGVGNGTVGRYADSVMDEIGGVPTSGFVDFGKKGSNDPASMRFESTKTFEGSFDVVTYLGNGSTSDLGIELQKSVDGNEWTTVQALNYTKNQRYYKKTRIHMEETTPVYLRVAQVSGGIKGYIYDIYVIRTVGTSTAISNVKAETESAAKVGKFVKDGRIYIQKGAALYNVAGAQVK